jgi:hypothetical protein
LIAQGSLLLIGQERGLIGEDLIELLLVGQQALLVARV